MDLEAELNLWPPSLLMISLFPSLIAFVVMYCFEYIAFGTLLSCHQIARGCHQQWLLGVARSRHSPLFQESDVLPGKFG